MVGFRGVYNVDVDLHDVDLVATDIFCSVFFCFKVNIYKNKIPVSHAIIGIETNIYVPR
jgi:hypothetical protein